MMRKTLLANTLAGAALVVAMAAPAQDVKTPAEPPAPATAPAPGMGPGMGGPGMGPGMGRGMGPNMNQGMMHDCPYAGPGMMGYGMGQGMGPGMGPGMMGPGMGPAMMGGYDLGALLNLNAEQNKKVTQIQDELRKKHWELMGKMGDESAKLRDLYNADQRDPSAIGQEAQRIFDLKRQMMESAVDAQNRIEAVLTPEQKSQMRNYYGRGMMMW